MSQKLSYVEAEIMASHEVIPKIVDSVCQAMGGTRAERMKTYLVTS